MLQFRTYLKPLDDFLTEVFIQELRMRAPDIPDQLWMGYIRIQYDRMKSTLLFQNPEHQLKTLADSLIAHLKYKQQIQLSESNRIPDECRTSDQYIANRAMKARAQNFDGISLTRRPPLAVLNNLKLWDV